MAKFYHFLLFISAAFPCDSSIKISQKISQHEKEYRARERERDGNENEELYSDRLWLTLEHAKKKLRESPHSFCFAQIYRSDRNRYRKVRLQGESEEGGGVMMEDNLSSSHRASSCSVSSLADIKRERNELLWTLLLVQHIGNGSRSFSLRYRPTFRPFVSDDAAKLDERKLFLLPLKIFAVRKFLRNCFQGASKSAWLMVIRRN